MENASLSLGGEKIIHNSSISIHHGEQLALIGPSGAGKTTLLRMLAGGLICDSGSVSHGGESFAKATPADLNRLRSRVGFIHQDHALVPNLRVFANVVMGRFGSRSFWQSFRSLVFPSKADRMEILNYLERVGIGEKIYHRADSLSGGEQQRVAIVRALFQKPDALLADEPVASVDPERARRVIQLLCKMAKEQGLTLVVSLHDIELAREYFPRLIGLKKGHIAFDQPTSNVKGQEVESLYAISN